MPWDLVLLYAVAHALQLFGLAAMAYAVLFGIAEIVYAFRSNLRN